MVENLKGMAGLAGLMKDLPKIKAKMDEIKMRLGEMTVSAETGGGAVQVTANGLLRVVSINLDQSLIIGLVDPRNPDDRVVAEVLRPGEHANDEVAVDLLKLLREPEIAFELVERRREHSQDDEADDGDDG